MDKPQRSALTPAEHRLSVSRDRVNKCKAQLDRLAAAIVSAQQTINNLHAERAIAVDEFEAAVQAHDAQLIASQAAARAASAE